jgi:hypothetical protein
VCVVNFCSELPNRRPVSSSSVPSYGVSVTWYRISVQPWSWTLVSFNIRTKRLTTDSCQKNEQWDEVKSAVVSVQPCFTFLHQKCMWHVSMFTLLSMLTLVRLAVQGLLSLILVYCIYIYTSVQDCVLGLQELQTGVHLIQNHNMWTLSS